MNWKESKEGLWEAWREKRGRKNVEKEERNSVKGLKRYFAALG